MTADQLFTSVIWLTLAILVGIAVSMLTGAIGAIYIDKDVLAHEC